MNNTGKMSVLLAALRKHTNGAVSGSMGEKGMFWPLNYGVSVPEIRAEAGKYKPDHEFAKLLYRQQVRELCLAGIMIADPALITADDSSFWAAGVTNIEVAEHISFLLAETERLPEIVFSWLTSGNEMAAYAALLGASRAIISVRSASAFSVKELLNAIRDLKCFENLYTWRAAATLLNNLYRFSPADRGAVGEFAREMSAGLLHPMKDYFEEELYLDPCE